MLNIIGNFHKLTTFQRLSKLIKIRVYNSIWTGMFLEFQKELFFFLMHCSICLKIFKINLLRSFEIKVVNYVLCNISFPNQAKIWEIIYFFSKISLTPISNLIANLTLVVIYNQILEKSRPVSKSPYHVLLSDLCCQTFFKYLNLY